MTVVIDPTDAGTGFDSDATAVAELVKPVPNDVLRAPRRSRALNDAGRVVSMASGNAKDEARWREALG